MEENEFLNKMENLKKPEVNTDASQRQVRLTLLNARKSAAWGMWFLVIPLFFFCCVAIKYLFHWHWRIANNFIEWIARLDHQTATAWVTPVLFVLLPAIIALINLLAIMHFVYDKLTKELIVTIKLKWFNIFLAIMSLAIVGIVLLYGIIETTAENAIKRYDTEWQGK